MVITLVIWRGKGSESIKPEGIFYSAIDEGRVKLQDNPTYAST